MITIGFWEVIFALVLSRIIGDFLAEFLDIAISSGIKKVKRKKVTSVYSTPKNKRTIGFKMQCDLNAEKEEKQ